MESWFLIKAATQEFVQARSSTVLENVRKTVLAARQRRRLSLPANVSPRTFRNYFSTKAEAVAAGHLERMLRIADDLRSRPASEPLWTAVTNSVAAQFEPPAQKVKRYGTPALVRADSVHPHRTSDSRRGSQGIRRGTSWVGQGHCPACWRSARDRHVPTSCGGRGDCRCRNRSRPLAA